MTAPSNTPFQGGGLDPDDPTHVVRATDEELYQEVQTGKLLCVFNARQMGKTTLQNSTVPRLRQAGFACIPIYLGATGSLTEEQWYTKIAYELVKVLQLGDRQEFIRTWWKERSSLAPVQRLEEFLETVLLVRVHQPVVVFFDEIDIVRSLSFSTDDFFALLRSCYQQRALKPDYRRLTFVLIGVATPSDLIRDKRRPPFNIGQAIHLEGFKPDEVAPLEQTLVGKVEDPHQVLCEILSWTGGQPFLTQKLRHLVETGQFIPKGQEADAVAWLVRSRMIDNWESNDEPEHLRTIRDRLLSNEQQKGRLLGLYQQILQKGAIEADSSEAQTELYLSGLVVRQNETLRVYNRLYAAVFDPAWVEQELSRLRPYAEQLQRWLDSGETDESQLLQGQALDEQLAWAKGKNLADDDNRFFAASQELARAEADQKMQQIRAEEQRSAQRLVKTQRSTKQVLLIGATVLAATLALTGKTFLERNRVQQIIQVERDSALALQRFEKAELDSLLLAMEAGQQLRKITPDVQNLKTYPTVRPLYSLQTILRNIREVNQFSKVENQKAFSISPDGKLFAVIANNKAQLWNYNGKLLAELEQEDYPWSLGFSPDSRILATAGSKTIKLWDLNGKLLQEIRIDELLRERSTDDFLGFSFHPNSPMLAVAVGIFGLSEIQLLNIDGKKVADFSVLQESLNGSAGSIYSTRIIFSPDGKRLLTYEQRLSDSSIARLWSLDGKQLAKIETTQTIKPENVVRFSPDGKRIAVLEANSKVITIRDLDGKVVEELKASQASLAEFSGMDFSPDGNQIVTAGRQWTSNSVSIWNLDGHLVKSFEVKQQWPITDIRFNGIWIATSSTDGTVMLWDFNITEIKGLLKRTKSFGTLQGINSVKFSRNGKQLITTGEDKTLRMWNFDPQEMTQVSTSQDIWKFSHTVWDVDFNSDGSRLLTLDGREGQRKIPKLRNLDGSLIREFRDEGELNTKDGGDPNSIILSPDRKVLAVLREVDSDNKCLSTIELWSLDGNKLSKIAKTKRVDFVFSPDNSLIATSENECIHSSRSSFTQRNPEKAKVQLWDLHGKLVSEMEGESSSDLTFSSDGKKLIAIGSEGIQTWDLTGKQIARKEGNGFSAKIVSPDRRFFASYNPGSGSSSRIAAGAIEIWSMEGKRLAWGKAHESNISRVLFSPDSSVIATVAEADSTVRLWNLDGKLIGELTGHQGSSLSSMRLAFSPDSKLLATSDETGLLRVWTLNGQPIAEFKTNIPGSFGGNMSFSPDSKALAVAGGEYSGNVLLLPVENLDDVLARGCQYLQPYFNTHPVAPQRLPICKDSAIIGKQH